jgi:hypothetical protein
MPFIYSDLLYRGVEWPLYTGLTVYCSGSNNNQKPKSSGSSIIVMEILVINWTLTKTEIFVFIQTQNIVQNHNLWKIPWVSDIQCTLGTTVCAKTRETSIICSKGKLFNVHTQKLWFCTMFCVWMKTNISVFVKVQFITSISITIMVCQIPMVFFIFTLITFIDNFQISRISVEW